jgi:phage shock protein PspC (stress-responsive transcriptional regulator)
MNTTPPEPSSASPSWGTPSSASPGSGSDGASGTSLPPRTSLPGAHLFEAVRRLGVVRPDDGRYVAGVAAGIARRLNVDPVAIRIGFTVLSVLSGIGLALYGLCWLLLPHPDGRIHAQEVLSGTVTAGFVGALLASLSGLSRPHRSLLVPPIHHSLFALAVTGLAIWAVLYWRQRPHK